MNNNHIAHNQAELPTKSSLIVWAEFIEMCGSSETRVLDLVEMGWLKPTKTNEEIMLFKLHDVYRLRKLERLCVDFELHTLGGSIVVDLLTRVKDLEERLNSLNKHY